MIKMILLVFRHLILVGSGNSVETVADGAKMYSDVSSKHNA